MNISKTIELIETENNLLEIKIGNESIILEDSQLRELIEMLILKRKDLKYKRMSYISIAS